jgi:micrococcal nuclease
MRVNRAISTLAFIVGASSCAASSSPATSPPAPAGAGVVVRVVDGDTVQIKIGRQTTPVRLIGVNTPETVDPNRPPQCFGAEAKKRTRELLPPGTAVRLERDPEPRDKYGRLLAYVFTSSGTFVNLVLAQEGFATTMAIAPNTSHQSEFAAAVARAREGRLGLWGACPGFGAAADPATTLAP